MYIIAAVGQDCPYQFMIILQLQFVRIYHIQSLSH